MLMMHFIELSVSATLKSYCPYCAKARKALTSFPLRDGALEWIEINDRADCSQIQNYLMSITGARGRTVALLWSC
uniref:Glutaredoxin domain-containing protein n=1 Tax=Parascaris equorum TaxID=6256 RepID=A0A914RXK4_PAREQ